MNQIFFEEKEKLVALKELLSDEKHDIDTLSNATKGLVEEYESLLQQTILITKVSDRLQNKLDKTNEKLKETNIKLKNTIVELDEVKIGKKASTIIFIIFIFLFFFSEIIVEPNIDFLANNFYMGLALKLIIAVLIKPVESSVEEYMLKKRRKEIIGVVDEKIIGVSK